MKKIIIALFLAIATSSAFASSYECERAINRVVVVSMVHREVSINFEKIPKEQLVDNQDKLLQMMAIIVELNEVTAEAKEICK